MQLELATEIFQTARADFLNVVATQKADLDKWVLGKGGLENLTPALKHHVRIREENLEKLINYENTVGDFISGLVEVIEERDETIKNQRFELEQFKSTLKTDRFPTDQRRTDILRNARLKWPELY